MSYESQPRPDISGKIAALEPSFRFLAERTGKEASADMMLLIAEHVVQQGLLVEAVNEAVRSIVIEWEKPYWPSPEYIANRARSKQRAVMGELMGIPDRQRLIDELCADVDQGKWDDRVAKANAWRQAHPNRFRILLSHIDADIRQLIASGAHPYLSDVPLYRKHFREGSVVGGCLRRLTADQSAAAKEAALVAAERARSAQVEDRAAMKAEMKAELMEHAA